MAWECSEGATADLTFDRHGVVVGTGNLLAMLLPHE